MRLLIFLVLFTWKGISSIETGRIQMGSEIKENGELSWWQQTVIYQIYPRSFQDSDGDGVGDIQGIISKLDHVVDLGIGAIWISPIYKSPMADFGYDISDFRDIDPIFGNMSDFIQLTKTMKEKGIKLIMDFVPNHSSDQHEWFQKSIKRQDPYTDYYVWRGDNEENLPNNWVSVFGGSMWEWNEERGQFYLHQFAKEQPDLNFANPRVEDEILAAVKFWIDMGVDGFRVDAVPHMYEIPTFEDQIPAEDPGDALPDEHAYWDNSKTFNLPGVLTFLAKMRMLIDTYVGWDGKERLMMTEGYVTPIEDLMKYYGSDERPIAHFPFNFELVGLDNRFTGAQLNTAITSWFDAMPEGRWANWVVGNHDKHRIVSRYGDVTDVMNMVLLMLPGTPTSYYGEEIGMENRDISWEETKDPAGCNAGPDRYHLFSRDPERTPMQWNNEKNAGFSDGNETWLPVHDNYIDLNVEEQKNSEESHYKNYKQLTSLRQTQGWRLGALELKVFNSENVFGFTRIAPGVSPGYMILGNFGDAEETVDASSFLNIPQGGTVHLRSIADNENQPGSPIEFSSIKLGSKNGILITFDRVDPI